METIIECFEIILSGDKEQSKTAARQVRKLFYGNKNKTKFSEIQKQINEAPEKYAEIKEDWRQENFVRAVSVIHFLYDHKKGIDYLFPWLFEILQHKRGNIRYAAVRMFEHEIAHITIPLRLPAIKPENNAAKLSNTHTLLVAMHSFLVELLTKHDDLKYKKYKYISSLPSSPYKSIQMVLGAMEDYCGEGYLEQLVQQLQPQKQELPDDKEIKTTRDELELQITQLLEATNSKSTVEDVKQVIYDETGNNAFTELLEMFNIDQATPVNPAQVTETLTDAWNYFPHKAIGGRAPVEIIGTNT